MNPQITEKAKKIIEELAESHFPVVKINAARAMRIALTDPELLKSMNLVSIEGLRSEPLNTIRVLINQYLPEDEKEQLIKHLQPLSSKLDHASHILGFGVQEYADRLRNVGMYMDGSLELNIEQKGTTIVRHGDNVSMDYRKKELTNEGKSKSAKQVLSQILDHAAPQESMTDLHLKAMEVYAEQFKYPYLSVEEEIRDVIQTIEWMQQNMSTTVHPTDVFNRPANAIQTLERLLEQTPTTVSSDETFSPKWYCNYCDDFVRDENIDIVKGAHKCGCPLEPCPTGLTINVKTGKQVLNNPQALDQPQI